MASKETFDTEIMPLPEAGNNRFTKLMTSLHEAQAQGVLRDEIAICRLMAGIEQALSNTIERPQSRMGAPNRRLLGLL